MHVTFHPRPFPSLPFPFPLGWRRFDCDSDSSQLGSVKPAGTSRGLRAFFSFSFSFSCHRATRDRCETRTLKILKFFQKNGGRRSIRASVRFFFFSFFLFFPSLGLNGPSFAVKKGRERQRKLGEKKGVSEEIGGFSSMESSPCCLYGLFVLFCFIFLSCFFHL